MELREINKLCNDLGDKIVKIKKYQEEGLIPENGSPYLIDNPEVFFSTISVGTVQAKAPEVEKFIARKMGYIKLSPSLNRGDFKTANDNYIELKNSFSNKDKCLNLRQLRLWQKIDYYMCIYIDEVNLQNSIILLLTHEQMVDEVSKHGSATHGTSAANADNKNIEYSITLKVNSSLMNSWIEKYSNQELRAKIIGG